MILYLAGPISNGGTLSDEEVMVNLGRFHGVAEGYRAQGYTVLNPAELPKGLTQEQYMRMGVLNVLQADEVKMLPGWRDSAGARVEHEVAKAIGTPVTYIQRAAKRKR